ncbi:MAG: polyhydroxyalkanoate depolymerase [Pseudomonadota bacterium]
MLYSFYEMQRKAFAPMRFMVDHGQHFFRNPLNPASYTPGGQMLAAAFDVIETSTRPYGKPAFNLPSTTIKGKEVAIEETKPFRLPFGQLRRFKRLAKTSDPKMLIVAPMSGHYATLLRGTVQEMMKDHDVYITDWRDAKTAPLFEGKFDLDSYIDYVIEFLEFLGPDTHVMAVCQPSVPVLAAVAHMHKHGNTNIPKTLTMMGGPIDTRVNPTAVNDHATRKPLAWFKQNVITTVPAPHAGFMRRVYPGFLQLAGFMSMNLSNHIVRHHDMFQHLVEGDGESAEATRVFYEEYLAVMDLTAEFYLDTVEQVFQKHSLPKGEFQYHGEAIDLSAIDKTALLSIEGERDDISGVGQTKAVHELTPNLAKSKHGHFEQKGVGHYGIFNGRKWRDFIAPEVRKFVRKHG